MDIIALLNPVITLINVDIQFTFNWYSEHMPVDHEQASMPTVHFLRGPLHYEIWEYC